jgi:very-short-patch-repair endonuclease
MTSNKKLVQFAKHLKNNNTKAEWYLWQHLRNRNISSYKFRRQHIIGNYIVDFVCLHKKLVVELDGSQHADQQTYDENRSQFLKDQGYQVLRFWNNTVLTEIDLVIETILNSFTPSPYPLPHSK